jgi:hypothetical protein
VVAKEAGDWVVHFLEVGGDAAFCFVYFRIFFLLPRDLCGIRPSLGLFPGGILFLTPDFVL